MISGRPRESLVLYDNAIEVRNEPQAKTFCFPECSNVISNSARNYRSRMAWTQMTRSKRPSEVSASQQIGLNFVWSVTLTLHFQCWCRLRQEKGPTAATWATSNHREHPQRHPAPKRMGWGWQALHPVRVPPASVQSWRCAPPWDARPKVDGAPSSRDRHLPSSRGTLRTVFRWDYSLGYPERARAWSSPAENPRRDQDDDHRLLDPIPI